LPTIYDDDLFVGSQPAFNDAFDTQVLGGAIVEAERRVGSRVKL
jgi:hypothetical protein